MIKYLALALLALSPLHAHAEDAETYSPDYCEFEVTFPGTSYKRERCEDNGKCYEQVSYTQVYELSSTVNFSVICSPVGENLIEKYDSSIMKATLRAMTKGHVVDTYETTYREEEQYRQAGLVGQGQMGQMPTIYIAQLWIGEKSSLSVEAELIGDENVPADTLFSDVLRSVGYKVDETKE